VKQSSLDGPVPLPLESELAMGNFSTKTEYASRSNGSALLRYVPMLVVLALVLVPILRTHSYESIEIPGAAQVDTEAIVLKNEFAKKLAEANRAALISSGQTLPSSDTATASASQSGGSSSVPSGTSGNSGTSGGGNTGAGNAVSGSSTGNAGASTSSGPYIDGVYSGKAFGYKSVFTATVTISGGYITNISISQNDDPEYYSQTTGLLNAIIAGQTTDGIDTVSGCTLSSRGVLDSVAAALSLCRK